MGALVSFQLPGLRPQALLPASPQCLCSPHITRACAAAPGHTSLAPVLPWEAVQADRARKRQTAPPEGPQEGSPDHIPPPSAQK